MPPRTPPLLPAFGRLFSNAGPPIAAALRVKESGVSGAPVRLTSDPSWGKGEAVLCGSERVLSWKRGATHPDIPEPQLVWWADLDFAPRCVWSVSQDGKILRIPLARTPNWKLSNPDDVKSEWWVWDNPGKPFGNTIKNDRGQEIHLGIDTQHIKDKPEELLQRGFDLARIRLGHERSPTPPKSRWWT